MTQTHLNNILSNPPYSSRYEDYKELLSNEYQFSVSLLGNRYVTFSEEPHKKISYQKFKRAFDEFNGVGTNPSYLTFSDRKIGLVDVPGLMNAFDEKAEEARHGVNLVAKLVIQVKKGAHSLFSLTWGGASCGGCCIPRYEPRHYYSAHEFQWVTDCKNEEAIIRFFSDHRLGTRFPPFIGVPQNNDPVCPNHPLRDPKFIQDWDSHEPVNFYDFSSISESLAKIFNQITTSAQDE